MNQKVGSSNMTKNKQEVLSEFFRNLPVYVGKRFRRFISMFYNNEGVLPDAKNVGGDSTLLFLDEIKGDVSLEKFKEYIEKHKDYFHTYPDEIYTFFNFVKEDRRMYNYFEKYKEDISRILLVHCKLFFYGVYNIVRKMNSWMDVKYIIDNDISPKTILFIYLVFDPRNSPFNKNILNIIVRYNLGNRFDTSWWQITYYKYLFILMTYLNSESIFEIVNFKIEEIPALVFLTSFHEKIRDINKYQIKLMIMLSSDKNVSDVLVKYRKLLLKCIESDFAIYDLFSYYNTVSWAFVDVINDKLNLFLDPDIQKYIEKLINYAILNKTLVSREDIYKLYSCTKNERKEYFDNFKTIIKAS